MLGTGHVSVTTSFINGVIMSGGSVLFRLPTKIVCGLRYFGLDMFARRIDADPVLTAWAYHQCREVH